MKTALLLIDIQNDYFPDGSFPLPGAEAAGKNASAILQHFRETGQVVVHVQHHSVRADAAFFIPGTTGAEINHIVNPAIGEKVITKNFPNSFRGTTLLSYLHENLIERIIICGMMTHMCVDATLRAAKDFGFTCTLIADACTTKDLAVLDKKASAEDVQTAFCAALAYYYAEVVNTATFLK
ncbi:MAG: cysteine hydrolase [Ignavibacteriales bacterium]|nr:cysteine hydrolase [Ignavibacteriales bacterium]